jgi:glyoxylase-like metal-dependent hydrolase (beta-lactamase superfamily II)
MSETVAEGVVQRRLAHAKVVYVEDAGLLVDTGLESEWDALESFLEPYGGPERVFVSHAHGDHVGNVERVRDRYDPELFYPANEPLDGTPLTEDDVTRVEDGAELADGVVVVEVPGHTPGICALHLPDVDTLLATDVLDGSDRRGLPAGYLLPPPATYTWDSGQAEENLATLLELEFDRAVVTHGSNVEADARLKLERFLEFTEHYRRDLLDSLDE